MASEPSTEELEQRIDDLETRLDATITKIQLLVAAGITLPLVLIAFLISPEVGIVLGLTVLFAGGAVWGQTKG
ncbi:hypothetical protein ACFQH2_02835 [Natronoarchaeum sp. GCM10025703]|uniref:hypothetical protein n=1 Tax=unclassified Natronoarchaeum TaxID=2620183 RepID=UPI003616EB94